MTNQGGHPLRSRYDAVVVGARCAGSSTAMLMARQGLDVLVVDRGRHGSDTLSTHAIMRGGVLQLHRWGLLERLKATGVPKVQATTFYYGDEPLRVRVEDRGDGVDALYAPRRTVLDALLSDAAAEAGAEVRYGLRAIELVRDDSRGGVSGLVLQDEDGERHTIGAGWVIGADGMRSTVARLVAAPDLIRGRSRSSVVYGYWKGLGIDDFRFYYRPGVSAGVIPTHDGNACVFAVTPPRRFTEEISREIEAGYHRVLAECSTELASAMTSARPMGSLRGFPGAHGFLRQCYGEGWALVGDAGYFRDPLTAHGITDALRDAELLARALVVGSNQALQGYQAMRNALAERFMRVTDEVASFKWDLPLVQQLHLTMSREMGKEVKTLQRLDPLESLAPERRADTKSGSKAA